MGSRFPRPQHVVAFWKHGHVWILGWGSFQMTHSKFVRMRNLATQRDG